MKKGFPCLRDKMKYETGGAQYIILTLACYLHNFCVRRMGLSQIMNTFTRVWDDITRHIFNKLYAQATGEEIDI